MRTLSHDGYSATSTDEPRRDGEPNDDDDEYENERWTSEDNNSCCQRPQLLVKWNDDHTGFESMKEGHRAHEWTELFFDLIFVAALVKLSVLLKQEAKSDDWWQAILIAALIWWSLFNAWEGFTTFHTRFAVKDELHNTFRFLHMLGVFMMAFSIGDSVEATFATQWLFALGAIASRLALIVLYLSVLYGYGRHFVGRSTVVVQVVAHLAVCACMHRLYARDHDMTFSQPVNGTSCLARTRTTWSRTMTSITTLTKNNNTYETHLEVQNDDDCKDFVTVMIIWAISTHIELLMEHIPHLFLFRCIPDGCCRGILRLPNACVIKCCDPDPDRASLYELYQRWWKQFYFLPLHAEHVSGRLAELCILVIGESIISLLLTSPKGTEAGAALSKANIVMKRADEALAAVVNVTNGTLGNATTYHDGDGGAGHGLEAHLQSVGELGSHLRRYINNWLLALAFGFHITWSFKLFYFAQPFHHHHEDHDDSKAEVNIAMTRSTPAETECDGIIESPPRRRFRSLSMATPATSGHNDLNEEAREDGPDGDEDEHSTPCKRGPKPLAVHIPERKTHFERSGPEPEGNGIPSNTASRSRLSASGTSSGRSRTSSNTPGTSSSKRRAKVQRKHATQNRIRGFFWVYLHPFLYFSLLLIGSSIKIVVYNVNHKLHEAEVYMLCYGMFAALTIMSLLRAMHGLDLVESGKGNVKLLLKKARRGANKLSFLVRSSILILFLFLPRVVLENDWDPVVFVGAVWQLFFLLRAVDLFAPDTSPIGCIKNSCVFTKDLLKEGASLLKEGADLMDRSISRVAGLVSPNLRARSPRSTRPELGGLMPMRQTSSAVGQQRDDEVAGKLSMKSDSEAGVTMV